MTSALELFYNRGSRYTSRTATDLGFDSLPLLPTVARSENHNHSRHHHNSDGCDPLLRQTPLYFRHRAYLPSRHQGRRCTTSLFRKIESSETLQIAISSNFVLMYDYGMGGRSGPCTPRSEGCIGQAFFFEVSALCLLPNSVVIINLKLCVLNFLLCQTTSLKCSISDRSPKNES
ncbi:unnamed protein product [Malus baccata var. baccata]